MAKKEPDVVAKAELAVRAALAAELVGLSEADYLDKARDVIDLVDEGLRMRQRELESEAT